MLQNKFSTIYYSFKLAGLKYAILILLSISLTLSIMLFIQGFLKGYERSLLTKIIGSAPHISIEFKNLISEKEANEFLEKFISNENIKLVSKGITYSGTAEISSDKRFNDNWEATSSKSQSPEVFFKGIKYTKQYADFLNKVLIRFDEEESSVNQLYIETDDKTAWDERLSIRRPIAFPPTLYRELLDPYSFQPMYPYIRLLQAEKNFGTDNKIKLLNKKNIEYVVVASVDTPISEETISIITSYELMKFLIKGTTKNENIFNYFELYFTDPMRSIDFVKNLREKYQNSAKITDWSEKYISELALLNAFNILLYSIMLGVGISIGLLISSLIGITVRRKRRQISVLLAVGSSKKFIAEIFIYYSLVIGIIGFVLGVLFTKLSFYAIWTFVKAEQTLFDNYPLIKYLHTQLQGLPKPHDIGIETSFIIFIVVLTICFFSSYSPAIDASKINPVEGLKES